MKKLLLSIIILVIVFIGCADKIQEDKINILTETLKECKTQDDKISGCVEKEYWEDGELRRETPYKNGVLEGNRMEFWENGMLKYKTPYKNDKMEGIAKTYYDECDYDDECVECYGYNCYFVGHLMFETPYKNDKLEGIKKIYYESGNLMLEIPFKNGEQYGTAKGYYENGDLLFSAILQHNDFISGKCKNGKVLNEHEVKMLLSVNTESALRKICGD